jgi:hypothetical protein
MSKPPRVPRYEFKVPRNFKGGHFALACTDPKILERVGFIAANFPQLEDTMIMALAVLMGDTERTAAGYIFRAIVASKAASR